MNLNAHEQTIARHRAIHETPIVQSVRLLLTYKLLIEALEKLEEDSPKSLRVTTEFPLSIWWQNEKFIRGKGKGLNQSYNQAYMENT